MKLGPKGHMVVIRKIDERERKSKGGIILPESSKNPVDKAVVVAVGPGRINEETGKRMPVDLEKDEKVLVPRWAGTEVAVGGEKLWIVPAPEILTNYEDDDAPVEAAAPAAAASGSYALGGLS